MCQSLTEPNCGRILWIVCLQARINSSQLGALMKNTLYFLIRVSIKLALSFVVILVGVMAKLLFTELQLGALPLTIALGMISDCPVHYFPAHYFNC